MGRVSPDPAQPVLVFPDKKTRPTMPDPHTTGQDEHPSSHPRPSPIRSPKPNQPAPQEESKTLDGFTSLGNIYEKQYLRASGGLVGGRY